MGVEGSEWADIEIIDRRISDRPSVSGMVSLEWVLDRDPGAGWENEFRVPSGNKSGTGDYVHGPDPSVRSQVIGWTVTPPNMKDANHHVKERVASTNQRYRQHLAREAENARIQAAMMSIEQARRAELEIEFKNLG